MSTLEAYVKRKEAVLAEPCTLKDMLADKAKREGMEDAGDAMAKQVGGNHYKRTKIQPWEIYSDYKLDPWSANVVKYILRFPYKAGVQDLEKAKHYIEYLIQNYETVYHGYYD
jgi:hypothetical protein